MGTISDDDESLDNIPEDKDKAVMPLWEPVLFVCSLENCSFASILNDGLAVCDHLYKVHGRSIINIEYTLPFFSGYLESAMLRFNKDLSLRSIGSASDSTDAALRRSLRLSALVCCLAMVYCIVF